MGIKFSEKQLLKIAESGLSDMSCEQIKQLIKKESQKDYEQLNTEFIDLCFAVLAVKQGDKSFAMKNGKKSSKKAVIRKSLLLVAIFMIFVVTALTVSASVFHFNIPKEISSWIKENAKTDINLQFADTTAEGYLLSNSDLAENLKAQGISPITFPEELIKEHTKISQINNVTAEPTISLDVEIEFTYNGAYGLLSVSQYANHFEWTGEIVDNGVLSAEMIKANGMDILIFEKKSSCTIRYKDNLTVYEFYLETDLETARLFAQSIK